MPLLRQVRAVSVCTALLAAGCLVMTPLAYADPGQAGSSGCVQGGPVLRYLVVFKQGTTEPAADTQIAASCGTSTIYYPQIGVAVVTSADPSFVNRIGPQRAYSAQGETYTDSDATPGARHKSDELPGGDSVGNTSDPSAVSTVDDSAAQWDMNMIRAGAAHRITEGSPNVLVGVLDSGIDANHPQLAKALDPAASAGCVTGKPDPSPPAWQPTSSAHGTHVAGIIAAADNGRGITGVAPGVRVASVKVVNDDGYIYPEAAVCAFMWAAEHHMTVTNSSYYIDPWVFTCQDTPGQSVIYEAVRRAVDYATAHGVLNVAAAGNQAVDLADPGQDNRSPDNVDPGDQQQRTLTENCAELPAGLPGVVTVSAVGAKDVKAGYSSYGLGAIDVTAPGGDLSQRGADFGQPCVLSTVPDGYANSCGTSMAAPHVAGVAALLASVHPNASPRQLTAWLNGEARPVSCPADYDLNGSGVQNAYCTGDVSYNSFYGHGMVDALAAVTENLPNVAPSPAPQDYGAVTSPVAAQLGSPVRPVQAGKQTPSTSDSSTNPSSSTGSTSTTTSEPPSSTDSGSTPPTSPSSSPDTSAADYGQRGLLIGPW